MINTEVQEQTVIPGCIEVVDQGIELLENITDKDYNYIAKPYIDSPIGSHMRHILDLFVAVFQFNSSIINYNLRRRGHAIETCRKSALGELYSLKDQLNELSLVDLKKSLLIRTENSLKSTVSLDINSTLERELSFAALHATHHYALIKAILTFCDTSVCETFGYAPTTASFLRKEA